MSNKMELYGVIAEYNPFHNGHQYLLEQARAAGATHIAAVMGGNFTQRGEAAVMQKAARVRSALLGGVDLVLELPLPWAASTAERFALGGVSILHGLGCVSKLTFGSECGDCSSLLQAAQAVEHPLVQEQLSAILSTGTSFAAAREEAVRRIFGSSAAVPLRTPNDILGVEYCKALLRLASPIIPFPIRRLGAPHDGMALQNGYASSTYLRHMLQKFGTLSPSVPNTTEQIWLEEKAAGRAPVFTESLEKPILSRLRAMTLKDFFSLPDLSEGLENRLYRAVRRAVSLEQIYLLAKTKRYSLARIRRLVLYAFLGIKKDDFFTAAPYIRVLGANTRGWEILTTAKRTATLPLVCRTREIMRLGEAAKRILALESLSADLYALGMPEPLPCGEDLRRGVLSLP